MRTGAHAIVSHNGNHRFYSEEPQTGRSHRAGSDRAIASYVGPVKAREADEMPEQTASLRRDCERGTGGSSRHARRSPVADPAWIVAGSTTETGASSRYRPSVLLVEDDRLIRQSLSRYLAVAGYRVQESVDIEQAHTHITRECHDIVILDIGLPDPRGLGRSGLSLLPTVRRREGMSESLVMIFTGYTLSPQQEAIVHQHRAYVAHKPLEYRGLIKRMETLASPSGHYPDRAGIPHRGNDFATAWFAQT